MALSVRDATPADADAIAQLSAEFVAYLRALGDSEPQGITALAFRRDGSGPEAAFASLVAEVTGRIVGYLLHHPGYDVDRGGRVLHIIDLYVAADTRRCGVGRALMAAAAAACRRAGGCVLLWSVYPPNTVARAFYERLGARYSDDLLMSWRP
jgi:GNAT superfamily N-acetyltransferase